MQHWWKQKCSDKNLYQLHLIHHKSQLYWPGIEPQPTKWQSGRKCFGFGNETKLVLKLTIMLGETCSRHDWTSHAVYKRLLNTGRLYCSLLINHKQTNKVTNTAPNLQLNFALSKCRPIILLDVSAVPVSSVMSIRQPPKYERVLDDSFLGNFVSCFVWAWNLVGHTKGRTQADGVRESGAEG